MKSGDNSWLKSPDHKTNSKHSRKERSFVKQGRGEETTNEKTGKTNEKKIENDKVQISLLLVGSKENKYKKVKENKNSETKTEEEAKTEHSVKFSDKKQKKSRAPKNESILKIDSILKNSNPRSEVIKCGVRFDEDIILDDYERSKVIDKTKKESREKRHSNRHLSSEPKKQKNRDEKSNYQLLEERFKNSNGDKTKPELNEKSVSINEQSVDAERFATKKPEEKERKKEHRQVRKEKKVPKPETAVEGLTVVHPEKKKREGTNVIKEALRKIKEQAEKELKHKREKKELNEKNEKKKIHSPNENFESDQFELLNKNENKKLLNDRSQKLNNSSGKHRRRQNESPLSEVADYRHLERDEHVIEESEAGKYKHKIKKNKRKGRPHDEKTVQVVNKLTRSKALNHLNDGNKENSVNNGINYKNNLDKTSPDEQCPFKKMLKEKSRIDSINFIEESTNIKAQTNKSIKLPNKENVLMKGIQDLTVKELYLMENLKDYELNLNEQFLKKIKKKGRSTKSTSDNINGRKLTDMSKFPLLTHLPVCKLPSVKEIFKISNLADYEKSYKEMQDKKKKRNFDVSKDVELSLSPRRKKLNKFSLESKEGNLNIKEKTFPSKESSHWLLKNCRKKNLKNEGGGELMVCNVSLMYNNENKRHSNVEKSLETGDARTTEEVNSDSISASKTTLKELSKSSNDIECSNYHKMCQKFHNDIREESKKLLQNLASDKKIRISIKDNSRQSIKKKPSLSSNEVLPPINNYKFDYVLLKKPKRELGDSSIILQELRTEFKEGAVRERMERGEKNIEELLSKPTNYTKRYHKSNSNANAFDKNVNKNAGVFIKSERKSETISPDRLNLKINSDPLSSEGNYTQSLADYNLSNSSYSLSMFDRNDLIIPPYVPHGNTEELDLLKRRDIPRESPNIGKRDKTNSIIDNNQRGWFQHSPTLERIINEIEEFPEKDTDPSCNLHRETKFYKSTNKTFSEIEKSDNVLLSYISHINYNSENNERSMISVVKDKKKPFLSSQFNDRLMKSKNLILNGQKYRKSHCSLKNVKSLDKSAKSFNSSYISVERDIEHPCVVYSRSCANIATWNNERMKKTRTNVLEASLQNASNTFKCDLKAEEKENVINTKLVISDPSKSNNILQIQFCGKLNINFNKDNIELGNDGIHKPLEIKYTEGQNYEDKNFEISRKDANLDVISLDTTDCPPNHRYSNDCLNKGESSSSKTSLSDIKSVSSKTIVRKGKRNSNLPQYKNKNLETKKEKDFSLDQVITSEINLSKYRDKSIIEKSPKSDISGLNFNPESFFQVIRSDKPPKTNVERSNRETNKFSLTDKNIENKADSRIDVLKKISNHMDLRVVENDQAVKQLNVATTKNPMDAENCLGGSTMIDENNLFEIDDVVQEKLEVDKAPSNLDACVQTVDTPCNNALSNKLNVLCCDVETCTSSFELKDNCSKQEVALMEAGPSTIKKEYKSYSSSTNTKSECTYKTSPDSALKDVLTSSSSIDPLTKKENPDFFLSDLSQDVVKDSNEQLPVHHICEGIANLPVTETVELRNGFVKMKECKIVTESSQFKSGKNHLPQSYPQNNESLLTSLNKVKHEAHNKVNKAKKKLLLSQSEEDAFKYLLLKSIGRTSTDDKVSSKSVHELSNGLSNPKVMFSAIRKRFEYFKSKSGYPKITQKRESTSKREQIGSVKTTNKSYMLERESANYPICSCGKVNPGERYWDMQKSRNIAENSKDQMQRIETHISNRSHALEVPIPLNQNQYSEEVLNDLIGPKMNNFHSISQYGLEEITDEMLYGLQNFSGSVNFSGNSYVNQYPSGKRDHQTVAPNQNNFSQNKEEKIFPVNNGAKNIGSPRCFQSFYERDSKQNFDQKRLIDGDLWTKCRQCVQFGRPCQHNCNQINFEGDLTSFQQQNHFPGDQSQKKYKNFKTSEPLAFQNRQRQNFSNDIFHLNPSKQYKSTEFSRSGSLCDSKNFIGNFVYNMENNSSRQEVPPPTENIPIVDTIDNERNKSLPRKRKFSKQASRLWKSLFKKSKKYGKDILEYEEMHPQDLTEQRPKETENKLKIKNWLKKISQSKANDFQTVQDKLFKKLNKIMTSEVTMPLQEVFDIIQKPQFHRDNYSYSGRKKFDRVHTCNYLSNDGHYIMITEKLNVRGFLVSIGLKDDIAWEAQDNAELNNRLQTAITEARSWVNKITMSQGLLIYILAVMTPAEVDYYYLQIVEAIINSRISNVSTLLSVVMVLKRYERGKYGIKTVFSKEHVRDLVPKQVSETEKRHQENRSRFIYLYNIAKRAAAKVNMKLDKESAGLLARLTASYSPGLKPYLSLLAHYIAQKAIYEKGQLTMAVSYLQSLNIGHFNQKLFEQNCGLDQNKVVLRSGSESSKARIKTKEKKKGKRRHNRSLERSNTTEVLHASWVINRKKTSNNKPLKESSEKILSDKSTLERKPSTMDLLMEQQNKIESEK